MKVLKPFMFVKNKRFIFMFLKRCFYAFAETKPLKIPSILVSISTFLKRLFNVFAETELSKICFHLIPKSTFFV